MATIPYIGGIGTGTVDQYLEDQRVAERNRGFSPTNVLRDPGLSSPASHQHALLGSIPFDLITYFDGMDTKSGADYAEHALIEGKPRLQWTGDKLEEISWNMVLHAGFCNPVQELAKLREAIFAHEALPLIFANGDYKGWFVPTEVSVKTQQTMRDGTLLAIEASLTLREYVEPKILAEQAPAKEPVAAEKPGKKKPAKTVKKKPAARPATQPVCRNKA